MQRARRTRRTRSRSPLEDNLLNDEERAVLYELDQSFLTDDDEPAGMMSSTECTQCTRCCKLVCLDKGTLSMFVTILLMAIGVVILVAAKDMNWDEEINPLEKFSLYLISAGVFGLAGGGTNAIAVFMLLFKIPCVYGSGVFYKRHQLIRQVIKMIVLQLLFDTQHLEHYITRKIKQYSSRVRIVDNITSALNSTEVEQIIEDRLSYLYSQPEAHYLDQLGLTRDDVKGLVKPSILSLCSEAAPFVLDTVADVDTDQGLSVHRFRKQMDHYLDWRVNELTEERIGSLMRGLIYKHLGWLVVWGCVFGVLSGIVVQIAQLSLNFSFISSRP